MAPTAHVYVDGFNLYYALRKGPNKWLDLGALFRQLLPHLDVSAIHYCTARIKPRPADLDGPNRQEVYLAALGTVHGLTIHYGRFLASKTYARLVKPPSPPALPTVEVHKMEEKGSDVNLATLLLVGAYENHCDVQVLVTNDSDLALPLQVVRQHLGRDVGLVNPYNAPSARHLVNQQPSFVRRLRPGILAASQFPSPLSAGSRVLHRPPSW